MATDIEKFIEKTKNERKSYIKKQTDEIEALRISPRRLASKSDEPKFNASTQDSKSTTHEIKPQNTTINQIIQPEYNHVGTETSTTGEKRKTSLKENPLSERMSEGQKRHEKYQNIRREDYRRLKELSKLQHQSVKKVGGSSPRKLDDLAVMNLSLVDKIGSGDVTDDGSYLPGIRNHDSAKRRQEMQRNQEYNQFKKESELRFQNRFANVKNLSAPSATIKRSPRDTSLPARLPQTEEFKSPRSVAQFFLPPPPSMQPLPPTIPPISSEPSSHLRLKYESKLNELERQVDELRKSRNMAPMMKNATTDLALTSSIPTAHTVVAPPSREYFWKDRVYESQRTQDRLIALQEADKRLSEIEDAYQALRRQPLSLQKPSQVFPVTNRPNLFLNEDTLVDDQLASLPEFRESRGHSQAAGNVKRHGHLRQYEVEGNNSGETGLKIGEINPLQRQSRQQKYKADLEEQMRHNLQRQRQAKSSGGLISDQKDVDSGYLTGLFNPRSTALTRAKSSDPLNLPGTLDEYSLYAKRDPLHGDNFRLERTYSDPSGSYRKPLIDGHSSANEPYIFSEVDRQSRMKANQSEYARELERQMNQSKSDKQSRKLFEQDQERKKLSEIESFNPFGRGGGGAPMKDTSGNVISDLRGILKTGSNPGGQTNRSSSNVDLSRPLFTQPLTKTMFDGRLSSRPNNNNAFSPRFADQLTPRTQAQTNAYGEASFARGGHGIFGSGLTDEQKSAADKYKEQLKVQIENRKKEKEMIAERERQLEEKEQRRAEAQQARIHQEWEEEQRKKQEKEETTRKANEEAKRLAEEKVRLEEEKRREERNKRNAAALKPDQAIARELDRAKSPPIPTLQNKNQAAQPGNTTERNPPAALLKPPTAPPAAPAAQQQQHQQPDKQQDIHVMRQLHQLRTQLDMERRKVEDALRKQRNEVEVFDPRLEPGKQIAAEPKPATGTALQDLSVFDRAKVARQPAVVTTRKKPPSKPSAEDTLEEQQAARIREQELKLQQMRAGRFGDAAMPSLDPRDMGLRPMSGNSIDLLHSDSAFINLMSSSSPRHYFEPPEKSPRLFDRYPNPSLFFRRNEPSARVASSSRRSSLNVDDLIRKNATRLRRLNQRRADATDNHRLFTDLNDDIINGDDDDDERVLNEFMRRHNDVTATPPIGGLAATSTRPDEWNLPKRFSSLSSNRFNRNGSAGSGLSTALFRQRLLGGGGGSSGRVSALSNDALNDDTWLFHRRR